MSDYTSCPNCSRRAEKSYSSCYFPVYKCKDCGKHYCRGCGGNSCPKCGSSRYSEVGKVCAK